jgi:hypothetical protein
MTSNLILDREQLIAANAIQKGLSVSMNAVFGSGKTTTILESVKLVKDAKCILVTYNTHLKNEVKEKVSISLKDETHRLDVFTYHSLSMKYFGFGKNDEELQVNIDAPPKQTLPEIDILFIDEIQDMTLLLYTFIQKFLYYLPKKPQLVICGDHLQGVYQFKGADKRFLTLGNSIFDNEFYKCEIMTSYRLTDPMGWLINECIYGKTILRTVKPGPPITFFNQSPFLAVRSIVDIIRDRMLNQNLVPEDIFILAPSLRCGRKAPLKVLENMIFEQLRIPIYYCTMEERELNDDVIRGKVVFSTFHQSKGRERKFVVVFGFDESYYEFYAKDEQKTECPSTLIVALSRSKQELIVVKDINKRPLPFMRKTIYEMYQNKDKIQVRGKICDVEVNARTKNNAPTEYKRVSVTDLVKYIKPEYQSVISNLKDKLFEKKSDIVDDIKFEPFIRCVQNGKEICEDISDLVGILVPSIFEEQKTGMSRIKMKIQEAQHQPERSLFIVSKLKYAEMFGEDLNLRELLFLVKLYKCIEVGIYSPFQIHDEPWISDDELSRMLLNIEHHVKQKQLFEYDLDEDSVHPVYYQHPDFGRIFVNGRIDSIDKDYVWEFKCVKELTLEHFLQVVCYQWLWNLVLKERFEDRIFRLLNIRTGEMYEMKNDPVVVNDIIQLLMLNRYAKMISISDENFISNCLQAKTNGDSHRLLIEEQDE